MTLNENRGKRWPVLLAGAAALLLWAPGAWANDHDEEIPFAEAHVFFELNDTDGDLGIHSKIDGEPWKRLEIEDPSGRRVLGVGLRGRLQQQGLTELFFESAEPPFDELSPEAFFERFPPGTYEVEGQTLEGAELESETELTHWMPAPPDGIRVSGVSVIPDETDCDEGPIPSVQAPVTIEWDPVVASHPGEGFPRPIMDVAIHNYEVVVEVELERNGEEFASVFSVILPPGETSLTLPDEFVALGDEFKFEILAREESYNQTAVESCFEVE
jgi:hypothetical protein